MDETDLFEQTFSAREVAEDGYEGMLAGKLDLLTGVSFGQRMLMKALPLLPKRALMKQVWQMQEVG